ncbi:unnamed protein product [Vitrella brassicaformis CCMP3155]|uniref:RNA-editing substrate-binding complex 6 protein domain-containing protein n=1 Tax=Vitrella brassicaformis (strain CCMP3155) TaxID=1169540 RepID=A0A0G4F8V6_VITBC|nr:unnamed protein product [Vitrella brassicaformis CCMP3155]|eukprot:CEM09139.1 unnamed protein product [Vitrella brassicaformis CCMP3155]
MCTILTRSSNAATWSSHNHSNSAASSPLFRCCVEDAGGRSGSDRAARRGNGVERSGVDFNRGTTEQHYQYNRMLCRSTTTEATLRIVDAHLMEFNTVNMVTAMHRVATRTPQMRQLNVKKDRRFRRLVERVQKLLVVSRLVKEGKDEPQGPGSPIKELESDTFLAALILIPLKPQELSNLVWSIAKLGCNEPQIFNCVMDEVLRRLEEFEPLNLSMTLWAFAKTAYPAQGLFRSSIRVVMERADDFEPQQLSNTLWAYSKASMNNGDVLNAVAESAMRRLHQFRAVNLSMLIYSFALGGGPGNSPLFKQVADKAIVKLEDFNPRGIANLILAFAVAKCEYEKLFRSVAEYIVNRLHSYSPQQLTHICLAFAMRYSTDHGARQQLPRPIQASDSTASSTLSDPMREEATEDEYHLLSWRRVAAAREMAEKGSGGEGGKWLFGTASGSTSTTVESTDKATERQIKPYEKALFDDLAKMISLRLPEFRPSELSDCMWAFKTTNQPDIPIQQALESHQGSGGRSRPPHGDFMVVTPPPGFPIYPDHSHKHQTMQQQHPHYNQDNHPQQQQQQQQKMHWQASPPRPHMHHPGSSYTHSYTMDLPRHLTTSSISTTSTNDYGIHFAAHPQMVGDSGGGGLHQRRGVAGDGKGGGGSVAHQHQNQIQQRQPDRRADKVLWASLFACMLFALLILFASFLKGQFRTSTSYVLPDVPHGHHQQHNQLYQDSNGGIGIGEGGGEM